MLSNHGDIMDVRHLRSREGGLLRRGRSDHRDGGATGHTGKKITEALLEAGERVRALGRSESKLAELKGAGAEVLTGDTSDAAFLAKAFRGADGVYTLLPTDRQSPDY